MKQPASIRFADVLAASGREVVARTVASAGAALTSWGDTANHTYALVRARDPELLARALAAVPRVSVAAPPRTVLRIETGRPDRLGALARKLERLDAPGGVTIEEEGASLAIDFDASGLPLATVVALVDVELDGDGHRIRPVLPLEDVALVAFAAALLGDPALDVSRLIETHLAPLVDGDAA